MVTRWIAVASLAAASCGAGGSAAVGAQQPPAQATGQNPLAGAVACVAFEEFSGEALRYTVITVAITPSSNGSDANDAKWYDHPDARAFSSGREGKFVWGGLQPRRYRLRAGCAGYDGLRTMIEVVSGETTEVSLRLKRPGPWLDTKVVRARADSAK